MKWNVNAYRNDKLVARLETDSATVARDVARRWKMFGFKIETNVPREE